MVRVHELYVHTIVPLAAVGGALIPIPRDLVGLGGNVLAGG
jgi:hypothetical protein